MKIFKFLFSRIALVTLLILLQLAAIVFLIIYGFSNYVIALILFIALFVIQIVVLFVILNKDSLPDTKITWIVFILGLPILGVLCYIIFENHGLTRKQRKGFATLADMYTKYCKLSGYKKEEELSKNNPEYQGLINYLSNNQWMDGYQGNKITYFKCGEEFFPDLISKLNEAQDFILMEFFIVAYGKEWDKISEVLYRKASEGVKVKFLYDDFGCSSTLKRSFLKEMRKHGIETYRFNKFRPVLSGLFNNRDHRKICVIDHKYGYTGGINLADEYANDIVRFGYWKDAMIRIEGPSIHNLIFAFFLSFDVTRYALSNYEEFLYEKYEIKGNEYAFPFFDGPKPFNSEHAGEQTFINLFSVAKKSITISTPYLIPTFSLREAIRNAAQRGIDVRLIVPGIPDKKIVYLLAKNNFKTLLDAGVKIYTFTPGFNHEKTIIIDDSIAFIGTINVDYRSLIHHFECGAIIYGTDAIKDMSKSLNDSISKSAQVSKDFKLSFFKKLFCSIAVLFAPLL